MKTTLIVPKNPFLITDAVTVPLGILYLAASLKKFNYEVDCIDMAIWNQELNNITSEVVGISFTSAQQNEAFHIAKQLKSLGKVKYLIAGGPHPTHCPNECLQYFDYIIQGEADYALPILLNKLSHNEESEKIINVINPPALTFLPFPDRDALPIHQYSYTINGIPATNLITSRSCVGKCSFCAALNHKLRMQTSIKTCDEIFHIHNKYGYKAFMIFDDVFVASKSRLKEIVTIMEPYKFIFRCFSRANMLTKEVCELLKRMNVVEVGVGIESGSNKILKTNMKGSSVEINTKAVFNLREAGIRIKAFMIVGLPGETEKTIEETRQWLTITSPDDVDISILQPMPGSDIYKNPEKYNLTINYSKDDIWYKGGKLPYQAHSNTKELTGEQLLNYRRT